MNNTNEPTSDPDEGISYCGYSLGFFIFIGFWVAVKWPMMLATFIVIIIVISLLVARVGASQQPRSHSSSPAGSYQWYVNQFFSAMDSTQSGQVAFFGTLSMVELKNMYYAVNQWKNHGGKLNKRENEVFDWMKDIIAGDSRLLFPSLTI